MSDHVNDEAIKKVAAHLEAIHFNGYGCSSSPTDSGNCSNCFGPSPMSAAEVALEAVKAATPILNAAARDVGYRAGLAAQPDTTYVSGVSYGREDERLVIAMELRHMADDLVDGS